MSVKLSIREILTEMLSGQDILNAQSDRRMKNIQKTNKHTIALDTENNRRMKRAAKTFG